jgi:hypothetical protein
LFINVPAGIKTINNENLRLRQGFSETNMMSKIPTRAKNYIRRVRRKPWQGCEGFVLLQKWPHRSRKAL